MKDVYTMSIDEVISPSDYYYKSFS